jgi:hypothetical protein
MYENRKQRTKEIALTGGETEMLELNDTENGVLVNLIHTLHVFKGVIDLHVTLEGYGLNCSMLYQ